MKAQGRATKRNRVRVPIGMLLFAGIASASLSYFGFQTRMTLPGTFWLMLGMIALAQLMPVDLTCGGVRVLFALPFVTALAVFFGPAAALLGDLMGHGLGAAFSLRRDEESGSAMRTTANMAIS